MADRRSNFVGTFETTLSLAMGATDTTAVVVTTAGAPSSPCYMTIDPENDAKREHIYFDGAFTGTSFVTTDLANRFLSGSAAGSGISHSPGAVVRFTAVGPMFEDLHDRIDADETANATAHATFLDAADMTTHEGAADPHTGYQKESEKGAANGYASLGADGLVPDAQLPSNATSVVIETAMVAADEATTSSSYVDLTTSGPAVTIDVPASGRVLLILSATTYSSGANRNDMSFGGGPGVDDARALRVNAGTAAEAHAMVIPLTGQTPGSTTYTAKYKTNGGTGRWANRRITAMTWE